MALFNLGGVPLSPQTLSALLALLGGGGGEGGEALTAEMLGNALFWDSVTPKVHVNTDNRTIGLGSSDGQTFLKVKDGGLTAQQLAANINAVTKSFISDKVDGFDLQDFFKGLGTDQNVITVSNKSAGAHGAYLSDFGNLSNALDYVIAMTGDWVIEVAGGDYVIPLDKEILDQRITIKGSGIDATSITYATPTDYGIAVKRTLSSTVLLMKDLTLHIGAKPVIRFSADCTQNGAEILYDNVRMIADEASSAAVNAYGGNAANKITMINTSVDFNAKAGCQFQFSANSSIYTTYVFNNLRVTGVSSDTLYFITGFQDIVVDVCDFFNQRLCFSKGAGDGTGYIRSSSFYEVSVINNAASVSLLGNFVKSVTAYATNKNVTNSSLVVGNNVTAGSNTNMVFSTSSALALGNRVSGVLTCFLSPAGLVAGNYYSDNINNECKFVDASVSGSFLSGNRVGAVKYYLYAPAGKVYVSGDYVVYSYLNLVYLSGSSEVYMFGLQGTVCPKFTGAGAGTAVVIMKNCSFSRSSSTSWFGNATAINKLVLDSIDVSGVYGGGPFDVLNLTTKVTNAEIYNCRFPAHYGDPDLTGVTLKAYNVNLVFADTGDDVSHCEEYQYG